MLLALIGCTYTGDLGGHPLTTAGTGATSPGTTLDSDGGTGETGTGACDEVSRTAVDADDATLGFSLDDWVAQVAGDHVDTFSWSEGGEVGATLSLAAAGDAELVDLEVRTDTSTSATFDCADHLDFPVSIAFATDDGAFDEAGELTLSVTALGGTPFWWTIAEGDLGGSYVVSHLDPDAPGPSVSIQGQVGPGESDGSIWEIPRDPGARSARLASTSTSTTVSTGFAEYRVGDWTGP